jgi:hypothetical protein
MEQQFELRFSDMSLDHDVIEVFVEKGIPTLQVLKCLEEVFDEYPHADILVTRCKESS